MTKAPALAGALILAVRIISSNVPGRTAVHKGEIGPSFPFQLQTYFRNPLIFSNIENAQLYSPEAFPED